ncbi:hypothetical protein [Paracoccus sp. SCSIO 75233]|nr:hypothetical protein [Paracoccus sp. SCSIO 75233]WBU54236.1 hypothetical protein PAF12_05230 [Paracoccus sp. SCSIO 75233]
MSKKIAFALVAVGILAACQPRQPDYTTTGPVVPVTQEPVYQGKYGAN